MINLVPPEAERLIKKEYYFRVGGTIAFLLAGVFLALTVALIPTYVLIAAQIQTSYDSHMVRDDESFKQADVEVKTVEQLLRQLTLESAVIPTSTAVEEIQALSSTGIAFKTFVIEDAGGVITRIQIQGTASTREALAQFKARVETSANFLKAEVPIADLARDVNLPFTMTITMAEKE